MPDDADGIDDLVAIRYDRRPESLYSRMVEGGAHLPVKVWLVHPDGTSLFTGQGPSIGSDAF